ncbi:MAG: helicase-related protein, partial [Candidatus ainarchaeum sp.]|nr:helicase-related protein [Candidatus ainarchaeum sp.]
ITGTSNKTSSLRHILAFKENQNYLQTTLDFLKKIDKKTLVFGNSHSAVEKLAFYGKQKGIDIGVYRGGLDYKKRKTIENRFKNGEINYLATTSALELGMDIGDVDAVILAGYPGTITRVKQRIGRAGRRGQEAIAIFIAKETPLDQYYIDNPQEYLYGTPESCYINKDNEEIKKIHIIAASRDRLIHLNDLNRNRFKYLKNQNFSNELEIKYLNLLEQEGLLKRWSNFYSPTPKGLALLNSLNLRGIGNNLIIYNIENNRPIGERELHLGINELYEGAIYFHSGEQFISEKLDLKNKKVYLSPIKNEILEEITYPLKEKNILITNTLKSGEFNDFPINFGNVHIKNSIYGYIVKDSYSGLKLGEYKYREPYISEFEGRAFWVDLEKLHNIIDDFSAGLHAFEHITISMIPGLLGCAQSEIGGFSYPSGEVFIFDSLPSGNGIIEQVYNNFSEICSMAYNRISNCKCESGCPKCIFDQMCGNDNRFLNKNSAKSILENILSVK